MTEPAKKRGRDADAAREAILKAAEDVFAEKGFGGARVDEISKACGYSNSLIVHHYFKGKEDLYEAVIRCLKEEKIERLRQIMTPTGFYDDAPLDARAVQRFIEESIRLTFHHFIQHPGFLRIMAWEAAEGWDRLNKFEVKPEDRQWCEEISAFLRRAQAEGIICPKLDPKMLMTMVTGLSLHYLLSVPRYEVLFAGEDLSSPEALAEACEQIVTLIVHGILVHPKETLPNATGL